MVSIRIQSIKLRRDKNKVIPSQEINKKPTLKVNDPTGQSGKVEEDFKEHVLETKEAGFGIVRYDKNEENCYNVFKILHNLQETPINKEYEVDLVSDFKKPEVIRYSSSIVYPP